MDLSLSPSTLNNWKPTYHTIRDIILMLKLVSCLTARQWVISRHFGTIYMLIITAKPYLPIYPGELTPLGVFIVVALYNTQEQARSFLTMPFNVDIENLYVLSER